MFSSISKLFRRNRKSATGRTSFRPEMLSLEARVVPSTTVTTVNGGSTLQIIGDAHANKVFITQDDANSKITVVADGNTTTWDSSQITDIDIKLKEGRDTLVYQLDSDFTYAKSIKIGMGKGNDTCILDFVDNGHVMANLDIAYRGGEGNDKLFAGFGEIDNADVALDAQMLDGNDLAAVYLQGDITGTSHVSMNVDGGKGNDRILFTANEDRVNHDGTGIDIDSTASLNVALYGREGNDRIFSNYEGNLYGTFDFLAGGGKGKDTIDAEFTLDALSTGTLSAQVNGGKGNDKLTLNVNDNSGGQATVNAEIDGGPGFDHCWSTSNVNVINCEA